MFLKEYERLTRTMLRQRIDPAYIRHYLIETYQLPDAIVDQVFATVGVNTSAKQNIVQKTKDMMGGGTPKKADGKIKKDGFF